MSLNIVDTQLPADSVFELDSYLGKRLIQIKTNYRQTGDVETALLAVYGLVKSVDGYASSTHAYQFLKLLSFYNDLKFAVAKNHHDISHIKQVSTNVIETAASAGFANDLVVERLSSGFLHLSVAHKAENKLDESLYVLAKAKSDLEKIYSANYIELIPLIRQEALIRQEGKYFGALLDNLQLYSQFIPTEAYASIKRVFERCLNTGAMKQADELLPFFKDAFRRSAPELGLLAKISFQKNLGHYLQLKNNPKKANEVFLRALVCSRAAGFVGQAKQIEFLLNEINGGAIPQLPTFHL